MSIVSSPRKLYVIGNGFDKHHGLPCGYSDFRAWLQVNRPNVHRELIRLYGESDSDLWSDYEKGFIGFNLDGYLDDVSREELLQLKSGIHDALEAWTKTIELPKSETAIDDIDRNAVFFTFNYTRTLEDFYGINKNQVVHLHGGVDSDNLVFGHDWMGDSVSDEELKDARKMRMDADVYRDLVHMKMSQEFSDVFRKPVSEVLEKYKRDFEALAGIEEMIVSGFSYSNIDMPYLRRIIEVTGEDIKATFSGHTIWDLNHALACSDALGVSECRIVEF